MGGGRAGHAGISEGGADHDRRDEVLVRREEGVRRAGTIGVAAPEEAGIGSAEDDGTRGRRGRRPKNSCRKASPST